MGHPKEFDCVKMKWDIQQELMRRFEGMDPSQARDAQRRLIEDDVELHAFLRNVPELSAGRSTQERT
jgi:hypothetical protein